LGKLATATVEAAVKLILAVVAVAKAVVAAQAE